MIHFFPYEDMNENIKMVESLANLGLLINGLTEIVKHDVKREARFLDPMIMPIAASLISTMATVLMQPVGVLQLLALPLIMNVIRSGVTRAVIGHNTMNSMDKSL